MQVQNSNLASVLKLQGNCINPSIVRQLQFGEPNPSLVEKFTKPQVFVELFTNSRTFVELLTKAQTFVEKLTIEHMF